MNIKTFVADYSEQKQANDIIELLDIYAQDPFGTGAPLNQEIKNTLVSKLSLFPGAFSVLSYANNNPVGLANCFMSFSTFKCKPIVNIHDLVVSPESRGLGISQRLLETIEGYAKEKDCCRITLEVMEGNHSAQKAYQKFGFGGYILDPNMGSALFWEKPL